MIDDRYIYINPDRAQSAVGVGNPFLLALCSPSSECVILVSIYEMSVHRRHLNLR